MITLKKLKNVLFALLGFLAALLLFWRRKEPPGIEEARQVVTEAKKTAGEIVREKAEREKKAAELKERLKKITTGTLVLVFLICSSAAGQNVYTPESYDELVEYYLAAVEVAQEYQRLYEAAEADVDRLLAQVDALAAEVERLAGHVEHYRRPAWGLSGGLRLTGRGAGWALGVSRRQGMFSWTLGVAGGDSFGVEVGVTVWW